MGEITVSVVGSKNPNWFDTHQIPKNAAYAIPDEAATRLTTASLDVTDPTAATRVVSDAVDHFGRIDDLDRPHRRVRRDNRGAVHVLPFGI